MIDRRATCTLRVLDVKKTPKGYYVHTCVLESGIVKVGDHLTATVDKEYRMAICPQPYRYPSAAGCSA